MLLIVQSKLMILHCRSRRNNVDLMDRGNTGSSRLETRHDPLTYIGPDRQNVLPPTNLPVPVGLFMNMAHVPPR